MAGSTARSARRPLVLPPVRSRVSPGRLAASGLVALAIVAGYQLWLRNASLFEVRETVVTGLTTADAPRIRTALEQAAGKMTTLNVDHEALERAVARFPAVQSVDADARFPNGLRVAVTEHRPVAVLRTGTGKDVPVGADGLLLTGLDAPPRIAAMRVDALPRDFRLSDPRLVGAVEVIAQAPRSLADQVLQITPSSARGIELALRSGPRLVFGSAEDANIKWTAATAALADPAIQGATYIDVTVPDRAVAGGLGADSEGDERPGEVPPPAPSPAPTEDPAEPPAAEPPAAPPPVE